jgi:predicted MFS family arabinose efflux permease
VSLHRTGLVLSLGLAQMLAWASTYYLPTMLATPMAADLGVGVPTVFAGFSAALLVSALCGPSAGHAIDRWGGRPVLLGSNLVLAVGLASLGCAQGPLSLFAAWTVIGAGMACGLYEAAFAALVRLHGHGSRGLITGVTLLGGLASTAGWPLSTVLEAEFGWRGACFAWAGLHLVLGLPMNALLPKLGVQAVAAVDDPDASVPAAQTAAVSARTAWLLAFVFAVTWFTSTAMAAHLPRVLMAGGTSLAVAVGIGALVGPAQVAGRLLEFGLLQKLHPLLSARLAAAMHPVGAALLVLFGAPAAVAFALLHGAGNGILTIAKGTLPLALFGPQGYGRRQGVLMVPARLAQALAPWLFGLWLDRWGVAALWASAALGMSALLALLWLRPAAQPALGDELPSDAARAS